MIQPPGHANSHDHRHQQQVADGKFHGMSSRLLCLCEIVRPVEKAHEPVAIARAECL